MTPHRMPFSLAALRVRTLALAAALFVLPTQLYAEDKSMPGISISFSTKSADGDGVRKRSTISTPGSAIDYSIVIVGGSSGSMISIVNPIPANTALFVRDLAGGGLGPVAIDENVSELKFSFQGLDNKGDSIAFSNNGGLTFDYSPIADLDGYDKYVTHFKITPSGLIASTGGAETRFGARYRLKVI